MNPSLRTPRPRPGGIERRRLDEQLDAGTRSGVTLVSAPAGYGKTTLVAGWARRRDEPTVWLSLESGDDDLRRFRALLAAGLSSVFPETADSNLLADLAVPLSPQGVVEHIQNVVHGRPLILVLDELHVVTAPEIMTTLKLLVERGLDGLRLILLTRVDPPLPWVRWMAGGHLILIDQVDLAFLEGEAAEFFGETMGIAVESSAIEGLNVRTEGWAAGLQLAALSLVKSSPRGNRTVDDGDNRWVTEYLMTEVLAGLPEPLLRFLLDVSPAPRLTAPLCDAMRESESSQELLQEAASRNLFLFPLDAGGEGWRFHPLFGAFLRGELRRRREPAAVAALCERAAVWFDAAAEPEVALDLACQSKSWRLAVEILETHAGPMLSNGESPRVARWGKRIPPTHLVPRRDFAFTVAMTLFVEAEWSAFAELVNRMRSNADCRQDPRFRGLESGQWLIGRRPDKALACLGPQENLDRVKHSLPLWQLGQILAAASRFDEADSVFLKVIEGALARCDAFGAASACSMYVDTCLIRGQMTTAKQQLREVVRTLDLWGIEMPSARAHLLISEAAIASEGGEWATARSLVNHALEIAQGTSVAVWMRILDPARRILASQGRVKEARAHAATLRTLLRPTGVYGATIAHALAEATHYEGMFDRADDRMEAEQIADRFGPPEDAHRLMTIEGARDRFVRLAIRAEMAAGRVDRAERRIADLRDRAVAGSWRRTLMELDLFEAQLALERGEDEDAERHARRCLDAIVETSMYQVALAGPQRACALVRALAMDREREVPALAILSASLDCAENRSTEDRTVQGGGAEPLPGNLSSRELEVLALAAEGGRNRQIAESLFMSHHTVKKHLENIYRKLGARSRFEAAERARKLRLLAPDVGVALSVS